MMQPKTSILLSCFSHLVLHSNGWKIWKKRGGGTTDIWFLQVCVSKHCQHRFGYRKKQQRRVLEKHIVAHHPMFTVLVLRMFRHAKVRDQVLLVLPSPFLDFSDSIYLISCWGRWGSSVVYICDCIMFLAILFGAIVYCFNSHARRTNNLPK